MGTERPKKEVVASSIYLVLLGHRLLNGQSL